MRLQSPAHAEAERAITEQLVHRAHRQAHIAPVSAPLHVITVVSNPLRYAVRYRLYERFARHMEDSGVILHTVELATRDRHFEVTSANNPLHVQVRSESTLWHKENMVNLGLASLPQDARYVAWIDSDITFGEPDWAYQTVHQLQIHPVVQVFQTALDMGPDRVPFITWTGLAHDWIHQQRLLRGDGSINRQQLATDVQSGTGKRGYPAHTDGASGFGHHFHPGYGWAARRETLDALGGLGWAGILGAGDHHMAWAMLNRVESTLKLGMHPSYSEYWFQWEQRAKAAVRGDIGYVPGTILHHWHGSKNKRFYQPRWRILQEHQYDYRTDVHFDSRGVLRWSGNKPELERDVLQYFAVRDEDATSF